MAASGEALPDGSFPIATRADLANAIRAYGRASNQAEAKRHIIKRARALGATDALPEDWMTSETPRDFAPFLTLEGDLRPIILEAQSGDKPGVMKLRVPFYVGDSITKAPGYKDKIHFPGSLLPGMVQEGREQIAEGRQPLTVYARHAQAASGRDLPVGAVVDLEQEGRTGYATLEISPTSTGRDLQELARNGHLNAVSLRSGPGRFALQRKSVNGEPMLQLEKLALDGIDFAPDGPAQPTFGLQILQEAPSVADLSTETTTTRRKAPVENLTLEGLRTEYPSLVAEIESPLRRQLESVTAERDTLAAEKRDAARTAKIEELASQFPEPAAALPVLLELCADCETDAEVALKALPVLLEAVSKQKAEQKSPKEQLLEMYSGRGRRLQLERPSDDDQVDPAIERGEMAAM